MIVEDQHELIEFLSQPSAYPAPVDAVERIDTHSATVFLVGPHAYKLKRAVRYDYLDFSTLARRRTFCEAEVALNRRTAPALYLGVVPVTREQEGRLAIGGAGEPIDWLVFMRRFPDDQLFDRLAARGALEVGLMPLLARAIARLHATAEQRPDKGGVDGLRWVVDGNEQGLTEQGAGVLDEALCARVIERSRTALDRHAPLLETRRQRGCVRVCHGDLHLGNIVLLDREPVLFDAVEFNDDISCIDVLYDAAFVLMDLWRLDLRPHANELFNTYVSESFSHGRRLRRPGAAAAVPVVPVRRARKNERDREPAAGGPGSRRCARRRGAHVSRRGGCRPPPGASVPDCSGRSVRIRQVHGGPAHRCVGRRRTGRADSSGAMSSASGSPASTRRSGSDRRPTAPT